MLSTVVRDPQDFISHVISSALLLSGPWFRSSLRRHEIQRAIKAIMPTQKRVSAIVIGVSSAMGAAFSPKNGKAMISSPETARKARMREQLRQGDVGDLGPERRKNM